MTFKAILIKNYIDLAYDLGMLETPYPVRSAKLSNIQSWPDLDGWSPDKSCHDVVG